jgi:hypothetical protein
MVNFAGVYLALFVFEGLYLKPDLHYFEADVLKALSWLVLKTMGFVFVKLWSRY